MVIILTLALPSHEPWSIDSKCPGPTTTRCCTSNGNAEKMCGEERVGVKSKTMCDELLTKTARLRYGPAPSTTRAKHVHEEMQQELRDERAQRPGDARVQAVALVEGR